MLVVMELARILGVTALLLWVSAPVCVCEERTVRFQIREELLPPTLIGTLSGNASRSPGVRFKLMSPSTGSFLRFRESDGRLTLEERIDRERVCKRNPRCVIAFDVAFVSAAQFELFHVEVEVLDVNDNSPVFPRAECTVEISESAPLGTRVALDAAEDADVGSNSIQRYDLSENTHFSVEVITRVDGVKYAELVLVKPLDRESRAFYALKLVAADGGNPQRTGATNVTVKVKDSNDNSPRFELSRYTVDVPEDSVPESLLLNLNAEDPDEGLNGQVVYEFGKQVPTKIRKLFKLDYNTGYLTLQSPVDYEDETVYEIDVQASDLGNNPVPSVCKIIINIRDVNDNPPDIILTSIATVTDGVACISEATGTDILVALISIKDRDSGVNAQVSCSLNGGHGNFRLKRAYEGSYTIVTMAPLDREQIAEYNLTVVAEDFGVPPLRTVTHYIIRLTDVNDNAPVFSAKIYEGFIEENQLPGTYITTILASDQDSGLNGEITYELLDADTNTVSRFAIMNQAGNVYALQSFNHEVTQRLDLRVHASDRGWPQLHNNAVLVINIVDQNDNAPVITQPPLLNNGSAEIALPRDAPVGYIVTRITAKDPDAGLNAELTYKLYDGGDVGFAIDPNTGEIYISRKISYDEFDMWRVVVTVNDNGHPAQTSTATVHFTLTESTPANGNFYEEREDGGPDQWTLVLISGLTSSSLLFLAVLSYLLCKSRKNVQKRCADLPHSVDVPYATDTNTVSIISNRTPSVFDTHTHTHVLHSGSPEKLHNSVQVTGEVFTDTTHTFKSSYRSVVGDIDGYSTLPGYGRDGARPITVWKGNSMMTIAVRDPQISGKDSGKGDSDVNDSDSDISEGLKKDYTSYKGLWACTSECRILGHSDRCWSPSASRTSGNMRHLSTFTRTRTSDTHTPRGSDTHTPRSSDTHTPRSSDTHTPRTSDTHTPRGSDTHTPRSSDTHTPRSVALHSLTGDQQSQCDYIHICSPQSQRQRRDAEDTHLFTHSTKPITHTDSQSQRRRDTEDTHTHSTKPINTHSPARFTDSA
ncbi:protocadherin-8 [Pimephales promelas]|uniref:protocadherin-8 n=1 Tax=Pimephales promelas TaxID=90988 RepID=UPI00195551B4|nr:protocadherin-8 [Pimephales promelas]